MSFITVAGETQIAVKQGGGLPLNVVSFVLANIVGLGTEPVNRIEPMPGVGDIVADLAVTKSGYVNGNQVVYSLTMDSAIGDFDFNWIGLKDDEGVLIAVAYIPTISKTKTVGPVPGNNITRNFLIAFSGIAATAAIAVPAATWQIDFNARLWGIDDRERLSNLDIYNAAAFFGSGWQVVRQGSTTSYDVLSGLGYVGGIRVDNAATQIITIGSPPKAVWLDVSLEGNISDVSAVVAIIADANAHSDYTDGNGFNHYVTKIADIAANGAVTDLRVEADHEAKTDPHSQYLTQAEGDASYDPIGGLTAHAGASDPHSQYLTQAEGDAFYKALNAISVPTGSVLPLANSVVPTGFIKCNGAAISRTTYAALFAYLGTLYGVGDGSSTFNLPDLRGEFIRGWDNSRGVDSGRGIGTWQSDDLKSHRHTLLNSSSGGANTSVGNFFDSGGVNNQASTYTQYTGGNETRPRNRAMMYCVKY